MQPERGEGYKPWGVTDEVWKHRAVDGAAPGAELRAVQRASGNRAADGGVLLPERDGEPRDADDAMLAYTHDDVYKPVPGFKTVTGHFHLELNEMVRDRGTSDFQPTWVPVFRGMGINIVYLGDFHDDSDGSATRGRSVCRSRSSTSKAARKLSDKNFLVMPEEEVNSYFDGHWYLMTPKPVYFTHSGPGESGAAVRGGDAGIWEGVSPGLGGRMC